MVARKQTNTHLQQFIQYDDLIAGRHPDWEFVEAYDMIELHAYPFHAKISRNGMTAADRGIWMMSVDLTRKDNPTDAEESEDVGPYPFNESIRIFKAPTYYFSLDNAIIDAQHHCHSHKVEGFVLEENNLWIPDEQVDTGFWNRFTINGQHSDTNRKVRDCRLICYLNSGEVICQLSWVGHISMWRFDVFQREPDATEGLSIMQVDTNDRFPRHYYSLHVANDEANRWIDYNEEKLKIGSLSD